MKRTNYPRIKYLHFAASQKEAETIRILAEREAITISEILRLCVREAAERRGLWPRPMPISQTPIEE